MCCPCSAWAERARGRTAVRAIRRPQTGAVTAELAMALPLLMVISLCLVWCVSLGVAQVRCVDAAREAARALARGEDPTRARSLAATVAGEGASVTVRRGDGLVTVRVTRRVRGFFRLADHDVSASAVAVPEAGGG